MFNLLETTCSVCEIKVKITFEPKYNGMRGNCSKCEGNWPES